ncbi:hypothetical protein PTKIN_Ptkin02bG0072800 [Pterospermum kingtungense]
MDTEKGVITFNNLKKNSTLLGLQNLTDDDLRSIMREGDFDSDWFLNQMEFTAWVFVQRIFSKRIHKFLLIFWSAFDFFIVSNKIVVMKLTLNTKRAEKLIKYLHLH